LDQIRSADAALIDYTNESGDARVQLYSSRCQFNVAKLYETGDQGIEPDLTEAYKWYLIAARAGDNDARSAVERLRASLPAPAQATARTEAESFSVEPLA
jgi:TPR repeat protein